MEILKRSVVWLFCCCCCLFIVLGVFFFFLSLFLVKEAKEEHFKMIQHSLLCVRSYSKSIKRIC